MTVAILCRKKDSKKGRKAKQEQRKYSRSSGGFASRHKVDETIITESKEILKPVSHFNSFDKREMPEKRFFGKRTTNKKDLFLVVCSKCGEDCEVPFKPSNNKPIFCSNCFRKSDRPESKESEANKIQEKLDRILEILDE